MASTGTSGRTRGGASRAVSVGLHDATYPSRLRDRLGATSPVQLTMVGNQDLLTLAKTGLFCSVRCPGSAILRTYDRAAAWRDEMRCIISGFHSPIEKECLRILLRGKSPVIICPGRAIETMRIPGECRAAFDGGRVLFVSPFARRPVRVTAESAGRRNLMVAALSDDAYIAHIAPGGKTAEIARNLAEWEVPLV